MVVATSFLTLAVAALAHVSAFHESDAGALEPSGSGELLYGTDDRSRRFIRMTPVRVDLRKNEPIDLALRRAGMGVDEAQRIATFLVAESDGAQLPNGGFPIQVVLARPREGAGAVRFVSLTAQPDPATSIMVVRNSDDELLLRRSTKPIIDRTLVLQGPMEGSVYQSAIEIGASRGVAAQAVGLLAHRLDFQRDVELGDRLRPCRGGRTKGRIWKLAETTPWAWSRYRLGAGLN